MKATSFLLQLLEILKSIFPNLPYSLDGTVSRTTQRILCVVEPYKNVAYQVDIFIELSVVATDPFM